MIDGEIDVEPTVYLSDAMTITNDTYGTDGVTGTLPVSGYPVDSTGAKGQKILVVFGGGYNATTPAPIELDGYIPIWYDTLVGLYVYRQKNITGNSSLDFTLLNLVNP